MQTRSQGLQPQADPRETMRRPSLGAQHDPRIAMPYSPYQSAGGMPLDQYQYQQQPPTQLPAPPLPPYQFGHPQPNPFQALARGPNTDPPEPSSAAKTRKTKGHVASACVPCKRAHLR